MSKREAAIAVLIAFAVGVLAAGSLRDRSPDTKILVAGGDPLTSEGASEGAPGLEVIRWRVTSAFGTHLPTLGENPVEVADRLRMASQGRINWTIDDPGEVVPAFAIVDAVRSGKIKAGYTWLGYDQGRLSASVLFGAVPFGMTPWEYSAWWVRGGGVDIAREIYRPLGIEPILCGIISPETAGWFRNEIETAADLEGLKIRFAGLGGRVMQKLGASVTMLPGGEIFQALEKGAIDATEFSLPEVDARLGFNRVARYNYFPGWHQPHTAFHLVVNLETWNALSEAAQAMIELGCGDGVHRNLSNAEGSQGPVIARLQAAGVQTRTLSPALLATLRKASAEVLEEEAAKDADFARVLEHQRKFRIEYARWRNLAYPAETEERIPTAPPNEASPMSPSDG